MSVLGIRQDGEVWKTFTDNGDIAGNFATDEAAMWGTWITPENAERINVQEGLTITMDDIRRAIHLTHLKHESIIGTTHEHQPPRSGVAYLVTVVAVDETHVHYRKRCTEDDPTAILIDDWLDQAHTHRPSLPSGRTLAP